MQTDRYDSAPHPAAHAPAEDLRGAFRELHARRLHGFALLLTLGSRSQAARLTGEALALADGRLDELRHPERAAAWLRREVVRRSGAVRHHGPPTTSALDELGADDAVVNGLAALDRDERAGLIATLIERLDRRDVATVVGRDGERLDRMLRQARARYADAHARASGGDPPPPGPLVDHIELVARRAMS